MGEDPQNLPAANEVKWKTEDSEGAQPRGIGKKEDKNNSRETNGKKQM